MNSSQPDSEIINAVLAGNSALYAELVRRWQTTVMRYFLSHHSFEDAQELTQETFLCAWKSLRTYNPKWKFSTWLLAIAHQQNALFFRNLSHTVPVVNDDEDVLSDISPESAVSECQELIQEEEAENLWKTIRENLSYEQAEALWLFYVEENSIQEIAQILSKSVSGVKTALFRARKSLQNVLAKTSFAE